jgi:hypothetical protein
LFVAISEIELAANLEGLAPLHDAFEARVIDRLQTLPGNPLN